jgi:hypothetical protein
MANDENASEQDKQKLPSRDEKGGAPQHGERNSPEGDAGVDAPMDPEDKAFIKKNK